MAKPRNQLLDILKGICILLVIAGHAIQHGSGALFIQRTAHWGNAVFKVIYSFHMPLFMLISGYLFFYTSNRHCTKDVFISRFKTLLLPIFSFAVLSALLALIGRSDVSISAIGALFNKILFKNLWFLWAVFYASLAVLLVRKLFSDSPWIYLLLFAVSFFTPDALGFGKYKFMYPFFVCGYLFNRYCAGKTLPLSKNKIFALSGLSFIFLLPFYNSSAYIYLTGHFILNETPFKQLGIDLYRILIGFAGSLVVISLVQMLVRRAHGSSLCKGFSFLGKNSLGIYALSEYVFAYLLPGLTAPLAGVNYLITFVETMIISALCLMATVLLQKSKVTNALFLGGR